jgi:RimJ/RimL family protein N-acetyltransferase
LILDGGSFLLRPLTLADADAWLAGEDDDMRRGFEFPRASTRADVVRAIEDWSESWRTGGVVRKWAIVDAATGSLVGGVELRRDEGDLNLSYEVFPSWRRRGFASRAARLALGYAARELRAPQVTIRVLSDNAASLGVARRLGAERIGSAPSDAGGTHVLFRLRLR